MDKYAINFIYDVGAYLETLEYVKTLKAKFFVYDHTDLKKDTGRLTTFFEENMLRWVRV